MTTATTPSRMADFDLTSEQQTVRRAVREFAEIAFSYLGLDHRKYVKSDSLNYLSTNNEIHIIGEAFLPLESLSFRNRHMWLPR